MQTARIIASGADWRVSDVVCTSGPHDPHFEERHEGYCVAVVLGGTFQYRGSAGTVTLAPGSLLLGSDGHCFECRHDHATGDHCLSFTLAPERIEAILAGLPGVRRAAFRS